MKPSGAAGSEREAIYAAAASWTARRDRGLSAAEAIEFELWLAGDPRCRSAMQQSEDMWSLLERGSETGAQREIAAAARRRVLWQRAIVSGTLLAAASLIVGVGSWWRTRNSEAPAVQTLAAAGPRTLSLADGTVVRLNAGGEIVEEFSPSERRVRLTRGEAHFTVERNASWPFVVTAGDLHVRAVGTAFNVNFQAARVEVLVTEGRVLVATKAEERSAAPLVEAGERAVYAFARASTVLPSSQLTVTRVDNAQISAALAWHDSLVFSRGATLAELAAELERRFGQRVILADPEIAQLRAGGRLRSDDAPGFAALLATTFDLDVERRPDGSWVLRKKKRNSL